MSVLSADQFEQLYEALNSRDDARRLAAEHERGVSYNALVSIYAQKYQRAMKRSLPSLRAKPRVPRLGGDGQSNRSDVGDISNASEH